MFASIKSAGVTGRQRPCAGSAGESLRRRKRRRSGGFEAARRRAERMRHVRAANRRCTVTFCGNHLHTAHRHVRTPQDRILGKRKAYRKRSRQRRRHPLSRSRRSAREGTWGRRNAPRSQRIGSFIFRRRIFADPNSSVAQIVEEPNFCRDGRRRLFHGQNLQ